MHPHLSKLIDFNLDDYLNPYIPYPRLSRLPKPISRFLGYRDDNGGKDYKEQPTLVICFWSFVGAFSSLLIVGALFRYAPGLTKYNPPVIIASLGASAILDFNAIRTPLAQPRNAFLGQTLSAVIGVSITKAFVLHTSPASFSSLQYIAGAICCATSSILMSLTGTVHPPGGATAILAATNQEILDMGWMFVPFVMLGSAIMLAVACGINNVQRAYPVYWWTPVDLRKLSSVGGGGAAAAAAEGNKGLDLEKVESGNSREGWLREKGEEEEEEGAMRMESGSASTFADASASGRGSVGYESVVVTTHHVYCPQSLRMSEEESAVLRRLQERLRSSEVVLDARPSLSVAD